MKGRMTLALAMSILLGVLAFPGVASASEPRIDPANGEFPVPLVAAGGLMELRFGAIKIVCTSYKASGKFTSATTGTIETSFEKCLGPGGIACTTPGQPAGTITFSESTFHLVYLTHGMLVPGVLITPPASGVFSTTQCTNEIKGSGYMARLETPACGGKATSSFTFTHELDAEGKQKYRQVTATGTVYNLLAGLATEGALSTTNTWTLAQQATLTCV